MPGPIGVEQLKGGGGTTAKKGVTKSGELTIVANFLYPWANETEEIAGLKAGLWSPSVKDFQTIANLRKQSAPVFTAGNFGEFLGAIAAQNDKGLKQVNLITHANPGLIGFGDNNQQKINKTTGGVTLGPSGGKSNYQDGALDLSSLHGFDADQGLRDLVRDKFADKNSLITLYACHGGVAGGALLMMDMAKVFRATIEAFREEIVFCPDFLNNRIVKRTKTGLHTQSTPAASCLSAVEGFFAWHKPPQTGVRFT